MSDVSGHVDDGDDDDGGGGGGGDNDGDELRSECFS